ncbi:MAG: methylenetetrahydrofolate reductase C-terminal domain-containing protein [Desulfobacterales bacterium]|nr:methylenetetrahydrofolate reductase C-terminal domain-containing protein [Desulfobacterales bacterium]
MIVAERKPIDEIIGFVQDCKKILLVGCNECVTVCYAGGKKEVGILSSALKMAFSKEGKNLDVKEATLERQCDPEYVQQLSEYYDQYDAIVSMACGVGVQELAMRYLNKQVFPALNTNFMGASQGQGIWEERCQGCGECVLGRTGGICPIARCAKSLLNGPCGGSMNGKCEISKEVDCAWQLIIDRLTGLKQMHMLEEIFPVKDWSPAGHGGPRRMVREDLKS